MRGKYIRGKYRLSAILAMLLLFSMVQPGAAGADIDRGFLSPPVAAKPWVYWFWLNGNITREGITADLEAMKRAGIGGVLIMEVDQGTPAVPVTFMSDQWRGLFSYMVGQAKRLGLQVNMNNDAGWNGSGGPWVSLDKAMQVVVTSETAVSGPKRFQGVLPQPKTNGGYYRDIAVLALPTPATAYRIENVAQKAVAWRQVFKDGLDIKAGTTVPADCLISGDRVVDLTARMDTDARLTWDAPAGQWTVIRFGHTFTGAKSHPAPASGAGPECDKLSKEGVEAQFNGMMGKVIQDVGAAAFTAGKLERWQAHPYSIKAVGDRAFCDGVKESAKDAWAQRTPDKDEKPVDNQFYARDDKNEGTLYYNGTLTEAADSVFLKLYADDKLIKTESRTPKADKTYAFAVKLKAGLIKYKVEFGKIMQYEHS